MIYDAIIIGAGPGGCSTALWLKQLGFEPLLIDKNESCGGLQLSNPYSNTWIATSANSFGRDIAGALQKNMIDHDVAMKLGTTAVHAKILTGGVEVAAGSESFVGKYLVLATGTQFKNGGYTDRAGLIIGPGVKVASTSFSGKKVAILGGGDSAFENYSFIKERGAQSITVFARTLRARPEMVERAPLNVINIGNFHFDPGKNTVNGEHFDEVLILYGYEASAAGMLGLRPALSSEGFVITDSQCLTTIERVLAVGEIARRGHPCCVTAMADGVTAAKSIQAKLEASKREQMIGAIKRGAHLFGKAFTRL